MTAKQTFQFSKSGLYFAVFSIGGKDGGGAGGGWCSFGFVTENTCSFNIGKILFVFLVLKQLIKL